MLYVGDKQAVLYKGDFHPAALYKGGQMIAGYDEQTYTGTEITAADTYNDFADVTAIGKAKQDEIPTLDIPVPIELSSGTVTASPENGSTRSPTSLTVPSLFGMDGVYDTFENRVLVDGVWRSRHTQRWGKKVLNGTELISVNLVWQPLGVFTIYLTNALSEWTKAYSTHFISREMSISSYNLRDGEFQAGLKRIDFCIKKLSGASASDVQNYFATQHAAGTPVIIYYQLAEPIVTLGDPQPLSTYPHYTKLSVQGDYPPDVTAQIKTIRR